MSSIAERNRQNAKFSSGPRSPQGKARSSQNALKTGLFSVSALLASEDLEEYLAHAKSYVDCLKPQDPVQADLVKIYSDDVWRLRRIRGLVASQHALMEDLMVREADDGYPVKQKMAQTRILESFSRHEQRVRNAMAKSLKTFLELKKETLPEPPPEPQDDPVPEPESGFVPSPEIEALPDEPNAPETTPETTANQSVPAPQDQAKAPQKQQDAPQDHQIASQDQETNPEDQNPAAK